MATTGGFMSGINYEAAVDHWATEMGFEYTEEDEALMRECVDAALAGGTKVDAFSVGVGWEGWLIPVDAPGSYLVVGPLEETCDGSTTCPAQTHILGCYRSDRNTK